MSRWRAAARPESRLRQLHPSQLSGSRVWPPFPFFPPGRMRPRVKIAGPCAAFNRVLVDLGNSLHFFAISSPVCGTFGMFSPLGLGRRESQVTPASIHSRALTGSPGQLHCAHLRVPAYPLPGAGVCMCNSPPRTIRTLTPEASLALSSVPPGSKPPLSKAHKSSTLGLVASRDPAYTNARAPHSHHGQLRL